jgi:predicted ABC-type transport system involved in lysophospholipase L1 biosynthesis ATPase subunit
MLHVDMQSVNKWFDDLHVLRDITLEVERGERIVICGHRDLASPRSSDASTGSSRSRAAGSSSMGLN